MYYFKSRAAAGQLLAQQMVSTFQNTECAVVALSEGGVVVGKEIAMALECSLNLLLVDPIEIPGEPEPIGAISETGTFAFNKMYAPGQIEELMMDYRGHVEEAKRTQLSKLHQIAGPGASINLGDLQKKHLILVSDGFGTGYSMDIALDVFKPVAMLSLSVAAPVVSPQAVDHMRVQSDHVFYLHIAQNYLATDHYYDTKDAMEREDIIRMVKQFSAEEAAPEIGIESTPLATTISIPADPQTQAVTPTPAPVAAPSPTLIATPVEVSVQPQPTPLTQRPIPAPLHRPAAVVTPVPVAPAGHSILDQPAAGSIAAIQR